MLPIHILTHNRRIETNSRKIFEILTPEEKEHTFEAGIKINERVYKLHCGETEYEIVCSEIYTGEPNEKYLIVPEFLFPGRPYPVYVYLYGIELYSSNPKMGQREAAEKTRKQFNLKTFSHTTLGRAMIKMEKIIKSFEDESQKKEICDETGTGLPKKQNMPEAVGIFPSVDSTKERRELVGLYMKKASGCSEGITPCTDQPERASVIYKRPPYKGDFINKCHEIVVYTHLRYHCLLL